MADLITPTHLKEIREFIDAIDTADDSDIARFLGRTISSIYEDIPAKQRISQGRYSIIKKLGEIIYPLSKDKKLNVAKLGKTLFADESADPFLRSLGVQLVSIEAEKSGNFTNALALFEKTAMDEDWIVRECSAGFVRKLMKAYPDAMHPWYVKMAQSQNPMQRRFAAESLRPVAENHWFKKNPEFAFSILEKLYNESAKYPRTSVGNSLSDWMRIDEAKTLKIVKRLANSEDENSYWIAYRACRNLVKKQPELVMDILKTDSYKYKDRIYYRKRNS